MYISNATGCSSIWGGPAATSPYSVNAEGNGPAWANSLFEDNAEHGLGLYLGQKAIRDRLACQDRGSDRGGLGPMAEGGRRPGGGWTYGGCQAAQALAGHHGRTGGACARSRLPRP